VGVGYLEDGFSFFGVPYMNRPVLAGRHESFLVDGPHSINGIVVTFVDNLSLLLCLPGYHLSVIARADEVLAIEIVNI
jgi:hypothetical protein